MPIALRDPVPALQIQDELHLLREELGTFAGHYETLATACQEGSAGRLPPKILAATATVEGVDRQTRHLYGLRARRFPVRGYALGESFYTRYDSDEDGTEKIVRQFVAFRSPFLRSPEAALRVLEIMHGEIRALYTLLIDEGADTVCERLGLKGARSDDDLLDLLDKYDTTLTYVGAKPDGTRITRVLEGVGRALPTAGTRQLAIRYLHGDSSLDELGATVDALEQPPEDWADDERLDTIVATSVISHGVDVSRFNLMVMSGMPGRTAEYIQASSRSGRQYVGMVIVALSPWLLREWRSGVRGGHAAAGTPARSTRRRRSKCWPPTLTRTPWRACATACILLWGDSYLRLTRIGLSSAMTTGSRSGGPGAV